ncbi:GIY-YIG nuclease family protein [Danxiaibacter flavus]|uniref:GIY-YIG nuclease family protein n=1 Tax=Danxiaibacter flavus TaxID=3049108 RepID=UPI0034E0DD0F
MFYIYIIQSEIDNSFYKGYSENPAQRLIQHNNKESHYTSSKVPWRLVYVELMPSKREALIRERNLKKATRERLRALIVGPKNIVGQFL